MLNTPYTEDQFIGNMLKVAISYQAIIWKIPIVELYIHYLKRTPHFFIATYAYERMCSAEEYLHSILAVSDIQDGIINHLSSLVRILGHNDCNVSRCVFVLGTSFLSFFLHFYSSSGIITTFIKYQFVLLQFRLCRSWSSTPTLSRPPTVVFSSCRVVSFYQDVLTKARTWGSCLRGSSNRGTRHCRWMVDILQNPWRTAFLIEPFV